MKYRTILADPPWKWEASGVRSKIGRKKMTVNYDMMDTEDICEIQVGDIAEVGCHLWLWTDNKHLEDGFKVMRAWGFKYLAPIHWVKPSGSGMWFIHRTQTILFGYKDKCVFANERYKKTFMNGDCQRDIHKNQNNSLS